VPQASEAKAHVASAHLRAEADTAPDEPREPGAQRPAPLVSAATLRAQHLRGVLLASDLGALALAATIATALAGSEARGIGVLQLLLPAVVCVSTFVLFAHGAGLYHLTERHIDHTLAEELAPVFMVVTASTWLTMLVGLVPGESIGLAWHAVFWMGAVTLVLTGRAIVRRLTSRRRWFRQSVFLIGDRDGVNRVLSRIRRHPEFGLDAVGAIYRKPRGLSVVSFLERMGSLELATSAAHEAEQVLELVQRTGVDRVVVTGWAEDLVERTELIRVLATHGVYVDLVSGEPEALCAGASVHHVEGLPIMTVRPTKMTRAGRATKRAVDVTLSSVGLIALSPFFAYWALRIKLDSRGPVLFRQARAGRHGDTFEIVKFRTMVENADELRGELRAQTNGGNLFKLREDPRITRYGAKLRRSSIDELPQLWNVLRGDMSLVGPRPLPLDEAPLATDHFADRARVRPGMTGPWQIHGRSDIPFDAMVKLDYTYATTWSLREDLRLMIRTVAVVTAGRGAY
jgi:exopolysaccharide biosynthesis polyprenyl glycosylphosphotransferase